MSRFRRWRRSMFPKLAPLLYWVMKLLCDTIRLELVGWDRCAGEARPIIFAAWHGRSFLATKHFRGPGYWAMVSNSRDGEMLHLLFQRFGLRTIRGSTGREGVRAATESIRVLKTGARVLVTPDGPRGPNRVVQPGVVTIAQKSGALVVPVGVSANRKWLFRSWDNYLVPKPFSRAVMAFGEPIEVPADTSREQLEDFRLQIERGIAATQAEADRLTAP